MISVAAYYFLVGVLASTVLFLVFLLTAQRSSKRHTRLRSAVEAASMSPEAILQLFSQQQGGLPAWLRSPDASQATWLNAAMEVLWQFIDRAGTEWAFKDRNLETLLNSQTFWKPAWLAASGVVLQGLVLGHVPPRVTGVKVYPPISGGTGGQEALVTDFSFDWASKMQVQLAMKTLEGHSGLTITDRLLSVLYRTVQVKVVVQDLVARGQLRVVASPLLGTLPVVGAVRVSFLEPPAISYRVSSFGANPLIIPGLEAWLNSFIAEQVLSPFTFPEGFTVNVAQLFGMTIMPPPVRPEGVLSVTIKRALNVPRMDFFGLADPYVKLYLTKKFAQQTSIKGNTLSPVWDEQFDFLVHSAGHQRLSLELFDSEAFRGDVEIGHIEIPLSSLDLTPGKLNNFKLKIPRTGAKSKVPAPSDKEMPSQREMKRSAQGGSDSVQVQRTHADLSDLLASESSHVDGELAPGEDAGQLHKLMGTSMAQLTDMAHAIGMPTSKDCVVEVEIHYLPFTSQEADAANNVVAGLQPRMSVLSPRLSRLLRGGMLWVNLTRAEGLASSAKVTKKYRAKVKVGPRDGEAVYLKTAERTGIGRGLDARNPVFDQSIDFLVDGDLAHAESTVIGVELWCTHVVIRPSFKGAVVIPLADVLKTGQLHDTFHLEGGKGGRLELKMEWLWTAANQF